MSNHNSDERSQGSHPTQQRNYERQISATSDTTAASEHDKRRHHHLVIDTTNLDPGRLRPLSHLRHKRSKSRDGRLPRTMNQIASSAGARGLFPTWSNTSGKEKDRDTDDGLLRPVTRETTPSRWGSDSTGRLGSGSRRGSFLEGIEQNDRLGPPRKQISSPEDLKQIRSRRKEGEEYLRSALVSIGSLATDITRRLDYTYYNLLEKITSLNTTITSFQGLVNSTSAMFNDFEREVTNMNQEVRKQATELDGFKPQLEKIEAFEQRMKGNKERAEALETRLENMRTEIDRWEKKETEWQTRIGRRLRILWGVMATAALAILIAFVVQNWPHLGFPNLGTQATVANHSNPLLQQWDSRGILPGLRSRENSPIWSRHPSGAVAHHQPNWQSTGSARSQAMDASPTDHDPLKAFDEI